MNIYPIWHKFQVSVPGSTGADTAFFRVYIDTPADDAFSGSEQLAFEGRAVQRPGASASDPITIAVNDIVADRINATDPLPELVSVQQYALLDTLALAVRVDGSTDGDTWTTGTPFIFAPDWSWQRSSLYASPNVPICLNAPIRAELVDGSYVVPTFIYQDNKIIGVYQEIDNGSGYQPDSAEGIPAPGLGAVLFFVGPGIRAKFWADDGTPAEEHEYAVLPACTTRYELIYQNAIGGWDTLLVKGPVTRSESYDRQSAGRGVPDNCPDGILARESYAYRTGITEGWTLPLGTFTDEQAARMHHLTGSRRVWLHDIVAGTLMPITITDAECIDKTYRNQGRKRVEYTLTATTATDIERR